MLNESIADVAAIEIEELVFRCRPRQLGQANDPAQAQFRILYIDRQSLLMNLLRPRRKQPLFGSRCRKIQALPPVMTERKMNLRMRQRQPQYRFRDVPKLSRSSLDE